MKFEKRNFMGIELDVLVGHPQHDLLFVATQVARAAGLKNPSHAVCAFHNQRHGIKLQMIALAPLSLSDRDKRKVPSNTWLFDEPRVYAMLLKGNAPASEPFRKWVTEEVLPSIRKTGKYNAEDSTNPIAVAITGPLPQTISEGRQKTTYQPNYGTESTKNDDLRQIRSTLLTEPRCSTPVAKNPHGPECAT